MSMPISVSLSIQRHNIRSATFFEFSNYKENTPVRMILEEAENYLEYIPDSSVSNYMNDYGKQIRTKDNLEYLPCYMCHVKLMVWCIDAGR